MHFGFESAFVFISGIAATQSDDATVIEEGDGYKRIRVSNDTYLSLFKTQVTDNLSTQNLATTQPARTNEMVAIKTLRGLKEAGLPEWIEMETLEEEGYTSWSEVPTSELDKPIDTTLIDIDAMTQVEREKNLPGKTATTKGGAVIQKLGSRWEDKERHFSLNIDENRPEFFNHDANGVTASLDGIFEGNGQAKIDIFYRIKYNFLGVAYKARFKYAEVDVNIDLGGQYGITGEASYKLETELFKKKIKIWEHEQKFSAGFFDFDLDLLVAVDIGMDLKIDAKTNFEASYNASGSAQLAWRCDSSNCLKTRDVVDFEITENNQVNYEAQILVQVLPYADMYFSADLDAIFSIIDVANARIGVVAELPITYFGYLGNLCSDADNDGSNERLSASLIDVTGNIYAYFEFDVLGKGYKYPIDVKLFGYNLRFAVPLHVDTEDQFPIYSKNFHFEELVDSDYSITNPLLPFADNFNQMTSITLKPRACYPFKDAITYEIDWGDGSPFYEGPASKIKHVWDRSGEFLVRARMKSDAAGREFTSEWIEKKIFAFKGQITLSQTFEENASIDNKGQYDWTVRSGGTPSGNTGPSAGSGGIGKYAYMEASSGHAFNAGNTAIAQFDGSLNGHPANFTYQFDYHMFGDDIGTLYLEHSTPGGWLQLWNSSGEQQGSSSAAWKTVSVDKSSFGTIRFRAVAAGGYRGDIAIDNIRVLAPETDASSNDRPVRPVKLAENAPLYNGLPDSSKRYVHPSCSWRFHSNTNGIASWHLYCNGKLYANLTRYYKSNVVSETHACRVQTKQSNMTGDDLYGKSGEECTFVINGVL